MGRVVRDDTARETTCKPCPRLPAVTVTFMVLLVYTTPVIEERLLKEEK
jgi:hypothetical protein